MLALPHQGNKEQGATRSSTNSSDSSSSEQQHIQQHQWAAQNTHIYIYIYKSEHLKNAVAIGQTPVFEVTFDPDELVAARRAAQNSAEQGHTEEDFMIM